METRICRTTFYDAHRTGESDPVAQQRTGGQPVDCDNEGLQ
jgi:hypothetical protein